MKTTISLDLKKNRIRIHKQTLILLSNPEHVHLMVNPELGTFAIVPCSEKASDALKISYGSRVYCEIYSKSFTEMLAMLIPNLDPKKTYQLSGDIGTNKLIIFSLKDITPVDSLSKNERRSKT